MDLKLKNYEYYKNIVDSHICPNAVSPPEKIGQIFNDSITPIKCNPNIIITMFRQLSLLQ